MKCSIMVTPCRPHLPSAVPDYKKGNQTPPTTNNNTPNNECSFRSPKTFAIPLDEIQRVNVVEEKAVLPDVLPVNAKLTSRSPPTPYKKYSTRLNLSSLEIEDDLMKPHQDTSFHCAPLVTSTVTSSSCVISSINSVDLQRESEQVQRSEIVLRVNSGLIEAQIPDDVNLGNLN